MCVGVDVYNSIQLHFEDGRMATLHANGLLALDNTAILIGTDGYLQVGRNMCIIFIGRMHNAYLS